MVALTETASGAKDERAAAPPPIPGPGEIGDLRDPLQALAQFYRAFNTRDPGLMDRSWAHSPDVVVISPLAGLLRGWPAIRSAYERAFREPGGPETEFFDYTLQGSDDLCVVVGRERGNATAGGRTVGLTGRTTNVLRRAKDGTWKLVHHHISLDGPQTPTT